MTAHVLGIGIGLFIILAIWAVAIFLCLVSIRTEKVVGYIVIALALLITLALVYVPREPEHPAPAAFKIYDNFFIWRVLFTIVLGILSLTGVVLLIVFHYSEPRRALPIKTLKL